MVLAIQSVAAATKSAPADPMATDPSAISALHVTMLLEGPEHEGIDSLKAVIASPMSETPLMISLEHARPMPPQSVTALVVAVEALLRAVKVSDRPYMTGKSGSVQHSK